jgi:hypothetical protein
VYESIFGRLTSFAAAFVACAIALSACGDDGGGASPCDRASAPSGCGASCSSDDSCPAGLYCEEATNICTADCTASIDCETGRVCNARGRCVAGATDGGPDGGAGDAGSDASNGRRDASFPVRDAATDNVCADVDLNVERPTPNVLILVDRSSSMDNDLEAGTSRWAAVESVLTEGPSSLVASLQDSVRFGLAFYTANRSIEECPTLDVRAPALNNLSAFEDLYSMRGPAGGTPTGESIGALLTELEDELAASGQETILILATDGEPDSCDSRDATDATRDLVTDAVDDAFANGIRTFVISVGDGLVSEAHLQDVANAGLGRGPGDPDADFWEVTAVAELESRLTSIVEGEIACEVELDGRIETSQACDGTVRLDGTELPCNDDDGWTATSETTIRLQGAACRQLKEAGGEVTARFPCGVILI